MTGLPTSPLLTFSAGTLVLENAPRHLVSRLFGAEYWKFDQRASVWRTDARHYQDVLNRLTDAGAPFADDVPQWERVTWSQTKMHSPREEQAAAIDAWLATRRGCVVMPTGTGKTEVALAIMAETQTSTLVVAPVRDLMYQWHRRILAALGYDAGIIGDNVYRVKPVSVTTYDSACIHMERFGDRFGLLVFDECHHLPGRMRRDAACMSAAPWRLGLTATPERSDGAHVDLEWLIGPTVYEMSIASAKGKSLADFELIRIPVYLSDQEQTRYNELSSLVRTYMADRRKDEPEFSWEDLCADTSRTPQAREAMKAYRVKQSIEDRAEEKLRVLEDLFRLHVGEPVIVFAGSNAMARDVSQRFLIPCLLSHCGKRERLDALQGLESGKYGALVANRVLDEGVDLPEVKTAIVIGGTASSRQAKQRLGRVLRKSGNARARLYEVVCADTNEAKRSRRRRGNDAYHGMKHRRRS